MANTKITTNVIADGAITSAKLDSSSLSIPSTATATTQSAGDNSTKVATTAYVETAVSNLVSAAPAALDTLDELAAALGDDANFSTTITNSLALKAPLASPDFTGNVQVGTDSGDAFNTSSLFRGQSSGAGYVQLKVGDTASGGILIGDTVDDFRGGLISYGTAHSTLANNTIIFANNNQTITASPTGVRLNGTSIARDPLHVHRAATGDCQIHMTNTSTGTSSSDGMTIFANSGGSGIWQRENTYFRIATNNLERFRLAAGGELTLKSDTDTIATFMNNSDNDHNFKFNLVDASDLAVMYLNGKDGGDNKFIIGYGSTHSSTPNMLALKSNTASGELGFFTNATQRMHITPTGEVGIGKEASTWKLDVDSSDVYIASFDGSNNTGIVINSGSSTTGDIVGYSNSASTYNAVNIRAASGIGLYVDTSSNVGIAAIPSGEAAAAHVVRLGDRVCIAEYDDGSNPEQFNLFHNSDSSETYIETGPASVIQQRAGEITFKNAASGTAGAAITFSERFKLDTSGRFAMGNTPSISTNYILSIDSDASGQAAGIHFTHGTKNLYLGYNSTTATDNAEMWNAANGYLRFGTNNLERVRIDSSGRWMCGVTSAIDLGQTSVEFDGTTQNGVVYRTTRSATGSTFVKFRNSSNQTIGYIYQDGSTTVNYFTNSDYRLKENVVYDWVALDRLNQLKPARYNFIGDEDVVDGFIAHELQEVMPEVVIGDKDAVKEEDGVEVPDYQGVAISKLVPLLVKSVQELSAKVDTLEAEIEVLRNG